MFTFLLTLLIGIVYSTDQENCAYYGLGFPLNQCSFTQTGSFLFTDTSYAHESSSGYWCPENGDGTFIEYRWYGNLNCSGDPSGTSNIPCDSDAFSFSYCNCDGTADACGDIGTSTITDCDTGYYATTSFIFGLCTESNLTNIPTNLTIPTNFTLPGIKGDLQLIRNASSNIGSCVNGEYTGSEYASSDCSGDPILTVTSSSFDPWLCSEADCQYNGGVCSEYLTIGIECNELLPKTTKVLSSTSNTNPNPSSSTNSNSSSVTDPNPNTDDDDDDGNDDDIDLFDYNNYDTIEYGIVGLVGVSFITILICLIYCCCCKKSGKDDNKQFTTQSVQMYGP